MTEEARKLANKCEAWPNVNLQPEENRLIVAALRSQSGTLAREEVARLAKDHIESALRWHSGYASDRGQNGLDLQQTSKLISGRLTDAILALTPSHEAGTQEPVAWQGRDKVHGGAWVTPCKPGSNPDFEYRPLYASPARADDGEKAAFPNKSCQSNGEEA